MGFSGMARSSIDGNFWIGLKPWLPCFTETLGKESEVPTATETATLTAANTKPTRKKRRRRHVVNKQSGSDHKLSTGLRGNDGNDDVGGKDLSGSFAFKIFVMLAAFGCEADRFLLYSKVNFGPEDPGSCPD